MKRKLACIVLLLTTLISCTKSIALEDEETIDKNYHLQQVGASARDLLTQERFTSLKIEVQYMTGYEPDEKALLALKSFLFARIHKPVGISIITKEIASSKDSILSMKEIIAIEKAERTERANGKELTIYILYTNGYYIEEHMLGYAYLNTSIVIFGRNLDDNSNKFRKLNRSDLEARVLQHELCHLLGLVNVGTPLQSEHKDDAHGKHCLNKKCLMYYLTSTEESPSILLRKGIPTLDEACLQDLRANGGR
jgi:predicted Zn-dependent protease